MATESDWEEWPDWTPAERLWTDPTAPVRGRPGRGGRVRRGEVPPAYPWPLGPVVLKGGWLVRSVGARSEPGCVPHGHARAVWEHMGGIASVAVAQRRLGIGAVDTDLEFLGLIARHVVACRACVARDPNGGRATGHDMLWRAVGRVERLAVLARALDRTMTEEDA